MSTNFQFILLFILIAFQFATAIECIRCKDCIKVGQLPEECPKDVKGCISIRNMKEGTITRDCFTKEFAATCDSYSISNGECLYCETDGCNMEVQDPLICRHCHWSLGPMGRTCNTTRVCMPAFRTSLMQCFVAFRYDKGYIYGCVDEMGDEAKFLRTIDPMRILFSYCDSNECNSGADKLFLDYKSLEDDTRVCIGCYNGNCGVKFCPILSRFNIFCAIDHTDYNSQQCLAYVTNERMIELKTIGQFIMCTNDGCNSKELKPLWRCHGFNNSIHFIFKPLDACVTYIDLDGSYMPLGRFQQDNCLDNRRCLICRSDLCNSQENMKRLFCYHTKGPEGFYIRKQQVDFMDMCEANQEYCITTIEDGTVTRGCGTGNEPNSKKCKGNLCNRHVGGIYCYSCKTGDPNCEFSQREGPFEFCTPPNIGCYTRILGDSSVERGCAVSPFDNTTIDQTYIFCNEINLCNRKSTKFHSCHNYEMNLSYRPTFSVDTHLLHIKTQQGWLFETCVDEDGLPACYTMTTKDLITFGCTNEISLLKFMIYRRGIIIGNNIVLCDGHYCNYMP